MSAALREAVNQQIILKGPEAYEFLGKKIGKSPKTIRRWMKEGVPTPNDAFELWKALGRSKDEAFRLASEGFTGLAKETA